MQAKIIKDTESLITLFASAANSISNQRLKLQAKGWLQKHSDGIEAAMSSYPNILIAVKYLKTSIHNERLIKKQWLTKLRKIRKHLLLSTNEQNFSFDPDKPFTAYKILQSLFNSAKKEVLVYDGYVEGGTLDILIKVKPSCKINILTNNTYGNFTKEFKLFKKQFPNSEARKVDTVHDRFFIIDNIAFTLGTSLHSVGGKKYTHLFKADNTITSILQSHFSRIWATGVIV